MDSFELNKLLGALLGAVFIVFSVSLISDTIFYSPTPATPGYVIEVPEQEVADEAPAEEGPDVLALIADGDVAAGEAAFRRCTSCHTPDEGGPNRVGPNLWNTVMQPIADAEGFNYSSAMRDFAAEQESWTYEQLAGFLEDPRGYVPGTTMAFAGIRDVQEKANLIAFLRTLSSDPAPLPEVATEEDSDTSAEPAEPTPATDGSEVSPETATGVPAGGEVDESAEDDQDENEEPETETDAVEEPVEEEQQ